MATDEALISVVVSTYNHVAYIERALDSIAMQDYRHVEIVVADDCSSDGTKEILKAYAQNHPRVHLLLSETNRGNSINTLNALRHTNGGFVTFLEGDDYWISKDKLSRQLEILLKDDSVVGVSHLIRELNQEGETLQEHPWWVKRDTRMQLNDFLHLRYYSNTATLYRNWFKKSGLLNDREFSNLFTCDRMVCDLTTCIQALRGGDIVILNEAMAVYNTSSGGNTTNYNSYMSDGAKCLDHLRILQALDRYYSCSVDLSLIRCKWLLKLAKARSLHLLRNDSAVLNKKSILDAAIHIPYVLGLTLQRKLM